MKLPCRHCKQNQVARPRGLCFACYYTPAILNLYPIDSKYHKHRTDAEDRPLTEAEILAMPPLTNGGEAPAPYEPEPEKQKIGDRAGQWANMHARGRLSPETEPEAIAAAQRAEVRRCLKRGMTDVKAISEAVVLPVDVVERRMAEIKRVKRKAIG